MFLRGSLIVYRLLFFRFIIGPTQAHATDTMFFAAHVALARLYPKDLISSMHSTKQASFIVSDGTKGAVAPGHYAVLMREALQASFPRAGHVACNPFPGRPSDALGPFAHTKRFEMLQNIWGLRLPFCRSNGQCTQLWPGLDPHCCV